MCSDRSAPLTSLGSSAFRVSRFDLHRRFDGCPNDTPRDSKLKPDDPPFNAQERDIDLMLLEEMHCNPEFLAWIAERAGIPGGSLFLAHHSVYRSNGETDVLALVNTPEGRVALMVEDKIGAEMQPRQAERYHERGAALCADSSLKLYRTLLCAPEGYLRGIQSSDWHATLSFENIAQWFGEQDDARARWRRDTLVRAATRQRRSVVGNTVAIGDSTIARFKREYRVYVTKKMQRVRI